jgi:hypothetical protein
MGGAAAALLGHLLLPKTAEATTALALDLGDLVGGSYRVALVTPTRASAGWEQADGQRRIVTRTTVLLQDIWRSEPDPRDPDDATSDPSDAGEDAQEMVLLTLGGRVGEIQQRVYGEAVLRSDEPTLIFASQLRRGARRVVGMAQGHYPLSEQDGSVRLERSRDLPQLLRRPAGRPAVDVLPTLDLSAARRLIEAAR